MWAGLWLAWGGGEWEVEGGESGKRGARGGRGGQEGPGGRGGRVGGGWCAFDGSAPNVAEKENKAETAGERRESGNRWRKKAETAGEKR